MKSPIFIIGAHKSGSSLLRNLLDGHRELFVIPFETHFLSSCGVELKYPLRNEFQVGKKVSSNRRINLINNIKQYLSENSQYSDNSDLQIDEGLLDVFYDQENVDMPLKELYFDFVAHISQAIEGKDINNKRIVEKSVENAELAWIYNLLFENAYFIHIIRNPYANLVSLRKFKTIRGTFPSLVELVNSLWINYHYLKKNSRFINNYYVIKYEDLINNPRLQMSKLCNYLKIEFEDLLLEPTTRAQEWKGNSVYDVKFNGIQSSNENMWKGEITPLEIYYVNKIFNNYLKEYDYCKFQKGWFLKINKGERFKTYIRNRIFKIFVNNFA